MPSKKQRRRREKLQRHEWEEVYVDEEGNELDADEVGESAPARGKGAAAKQQTAKTRGGGTIRPVPAPSWKRAVRRLAFFAPLMLAVIWITQPDSPTASKLLVGLVYSAMFVPFIYMMDRFAYRTYMRRLERDKK
jgi:hypothetical protein